MIKICIVIIDIVNKLYCRLTLDYSLLYYDESGYFDESKKKKKKLEHLNIFYFFKLCELTNLLYSR